MLFAFGAASAAVDAIKSLTSSAPSSAQSTGFGQGSTDPFEISSPAPASASSSQASGFSAPSQISPSTMSALLAAQSQSGTATSASTSRSGALQNLFSQIDANGDGQITKSEFEKALGAGGTNLAQADHVFSELDTDGSGTVSLGEMSSALKGAGGKGGLHGHHHVAGSDGSGQSSSNSSAASNPLLQALQATSPALTTNGNGSTTAALTPADLSTGKPMSLGAPGSATPSYNSMEQMIQRQLQAMSFSVPSLSFNA